MSSLSAVPLSGRRLGWSLVLLALAQLIFSLDLNIVFVALPEIGSGLGFSDQTLQWVVGAYAVFAGGFLLFGGRAADLFGRRRMFVLALALYAVSSLAGGLAANPETIIIARAVQGIGGALLLPSTLSLVNTLFEEGPKRNKALAVWGGAGASGLTAGALLGGVLTQAFGWPAVFFVNVPLAGIVAIAALVVIPRDARQEEKRRFDVLGALTVTAGATLLVYALVNGPETGWTSPSIIVTSALAIALLLVFGLVEARSRDPLMPLRLFTNRSLVVGVSTTFIYMGTFGALPYFQTTLFQNVHGFSALQTGLAFLVPSVSIATGTQLGGRITTRLGVRATLSTGFAIGIVGTALMALGFDAESSYAVAVPGLIVSGVGQGIVWTAMFITASSGVAPQEQGVANGMATTTLNLGYAIGLAVLIAIANSGNAELQGDQLRAAAANGGFTAVLLASAGMVAGLLITLIHPRRTPAPDVRAEPASAVR
ncbi:drug resistance transporter, EmrB/QacA subfamily [Saccharopolyspora antimicrobica]|uniref:Drug resistance transporter, EmrB/QacA subfamily n=1 Tax=Saccharopolyspora antimicrobica TaxID=455193 RepID=A0A1I4Z5W5_9PSEU|nr:MFS transporter [Saccharopolyspora antimicrobica]RKT82931.1 EmrB/QacA subfamily drug resistance transporter [Saccharopolyspora antimicrobica]SFN45403.1 drug resistance transporter, EmrB/QacA subfamily [Saccharopolyspora antimicrobica]